MAIVSLTVGTARVEVDTDGEGIDATVRALRDAFADQFNIPAGATPAVNGSAVDDETSLEDGDEVTFTKPTGTKG